MTVTKGKGREAMREGLVTSRAAGPTVLAATGDRRAPGAAA